MSACDICENPESGVYINSANMTWMRCKHCEYVRLYSPTPANQGDVVEFFDGFDFEDDDSAKRFYCNTTRQVKTKMRDAKRRMRTIIRTIGNNSNTRLLDIGCNIGCLVETARMKGFHSVGIEVDEKIIACARKLYPDNEYRCATLETAGFRAASFDVINASDVIATISDPNAFFRALNLYLKSDGLLYLSTPELRSYSAARLPKRSQVLPHFVSYLTKNHLAQLLRRHKFDLVKIMFSLKPGVKILARKAL